MEEHKNETIVKYDGNDWEAEIVYMPPNDFFTEYKHVPFTIDNKNRLSTIAGFEPGFDGEPIDEFEDEYGDIDYEGLCEKYEGKLPDDWWWVEDCGYLYPVTGNYDIFEEEI